LSVATFFVFDMIWYIWILFFRLSRGLETGFLAKVSAVYPQIMKETRFLRFLANVWEF